MGQKLNEKVSVQLCIQIDIDLEQHRVYVGEIETKTKTLGKQIDHPLALALAQAESALIPDLHAVAEHREDYDFGEFSRKVQDYGNALHMALMCFRHGMDHRENNERASESKKSKALAGVYI